MLEYWYIWYEILEDGKRIKTGRYPRSYRWRRSAQDRAKQMWGIDLYSPIPGTNYVRRWAVSEKNPFEEG